MVVQKNEPHIQYIEIDKSNTDFLTEYLGNAYDNTGMFRFERFTTYFEKANFWFYDIILTADNMPCGVLKENNNSYTVLYHMNCGYSGYGPHTTAKVLEWLGISQDKAMNWCYKNAVDIHFNASGEIVDSNFTPTFDNRPFEAPEAKIIFDGNIFSNYTDRMIGFVQPSLEDYKDIYHAVQLSNSSMMSFYYGNNAKQYFDYAEHLSYFRSYNATDIYSLSKGGFIKLTGGIFDIAILADNFFILQLIQQLYHYYFQKQFFYERRFNSILLYSDTMYPDNFTGTVALIKNIFFPKEKTDKIFTYTLPKKGRK